MSAGYIIPVPFVPTPKKKRVSRASKSKALKKLLKQAKTPNAQAISPNPLPPDRFNQVANIAKSAGAKAANVAKIVAGSAIAKVSLAALAIYGISEGLFARKVATGTLPSKEFLEKYYPGEKQVIAEAPPPPFTGGQGEGVQYQMRYYSLKAENNNNYDPLVRNGVFTRTTTFFIGAVTGYQLFDPQGSPISFGAYKQNGKAYTEEYKLAIYHNNGEDTYIINFYANWGIEPIGFIRADGQPDTDGNISTDLGIEASSDSSPIPKPTDLDNFAYRDSYIGDGSNASFNSNIRLNIPTSAKAVEKAPPDSKIINELRDTLENLLGGKANATDIEALRQQVAETNQKLDRLNNENGIDNALEVESAEQVKPATTENPQEVKEKKQEIIVPGTTVEYYESGNTVIKKETTIDLEGNKIVTETFPDGSILRQSKRGVHLDLTPEQKFQKQQQENQRQQAIKAATPDILTRDKYQVKNKETFVIRQPVVVATPTATGTGVQTIPEVTELTQTPSLEQPTLKGGDIATVAALIAALPTQSNFTTAVDAAVTTATCRSTQTGCMRQNVTDPIVNNQNNLLNALGVAGDASILGIVRDTNNAVRHGTYGLQAIQNFAGKAWSTLKVDKMLNLLNTALLVHNAAMLSQNIAETVGEVVDNSLATLGLKITDVEGKEIGFTEAIGQSVTSLIKNIIGEENYDQLTTTWAKANRVYQASVNVLSNIRSIVDSAQDIAEETGENVAFIGNALRRGGVVRENSYGWMSENMRTESRWLRRLKKVEDTVDIFEDITDSTRDISEELGELKENSENFKKEIEEYKKVRKEKEADDKQAAQKTPDITEKDNQPSN